MHLLQVQCFGAHIANWVAVKSLAAALETANKHHIGKREIPLVFRLSKLGEVGRLVSDKNVISDCELNLAFSLKF